MTNLTKPNLTVFLCTWPLVSIQDEFVCYMCSCAQLLSHTLLFVTPWAIALQAPLSLGFPGKNTGVGWLPSSRGSSWLLVCYTADGNRWYVFQRGNCFWFSLELQIFKSTRIQRKEVWKEIWVTTGLFHIHFSLACGNLCT